MAKFPGGERRRRLVIDGVGRSVSGYQFALGGERGIWGKPYFLFGVKGQFERMRRGHGQMVQEGHM